MSLSFWLCGIGDRFFTPFPYCVPHHGYFPSKLNTSQRQELCGLLEKGARSMCINWGPVKANGVFDNDKCYVYEISPRFHGDIFTSNVMGFLKKTNPVYQLLNWIYQGEPNVFLPTENVTNVMGGWKTIFNYSEKEQLANTTGLYIRDKKDVNIVKNNNGIIGLAWSWEKSRENLDKVLKIGNYA